jgi:hypothetical protein
VKEENKKMDKKKKKNENKEKWSEGGTIEKRKRRFP